ncbi:MAG: PQQ-binding-like beta-propeller repeat protein [Cellvibrionaceae bacterium]
MKTPSIFMLALLSFSSAQALDKAPDMKAAGKQIFDQHCAACHDNTASKAPRREALAAVSFENIMLSLEFGRMQPQAAGLNKLQKAAVSKYLAGDKQVDESWIQASSCDNTEINLTEVLSGNWGLSSGNRRYLPSEKSGITPDNVESLKLKWSFAYPQVSDARSQPVMTKDTVFVGSKSGNVFALDKNSGCIKWRYKADSSVRSALVLGQQAQQSLLFFGDTLSTTYALNAANGELVWKQSLSLFPTSVITGSPAFYDGSLYVPISSYEIAAAGMAQYPCCRSHGAVVALDAESGEQRWVWHGTPNATLQEKDDKGRMRFGPSGVSVWSTPTVDAKRGLLYFGTAENLSRPATDTSDAVVAVGLEDGKLRWKYQGLKDDVWNSGCLSQGFNCPENPGPDFDFGASIILTQNAAGDDILLAGQKSGAVFAFDPDGYQGQEGKLLWKNTDTLNTVYSPNPGVHWGMAVEGQRLFVPIADSERPFPGYTPRPGLYAIDINTGKNLWSSPVKRSCELSGKLSENYGLKAMREKTGEAESDCSFHFSFSAAATATDGLVFVGGLDGILRAYNSITGEVVWQTETAKAFAGVNGIAGKGGSIDVDGAVIGDGTLVIHSGYSMFGQLPGNVLLSYEVDQ